MKKLPPNLHLFQEFRQEDTANIVLTYDGNTREDEELD